MKIEILPVRKSQADLLNKVCLKFKPYSRLDQVAAKNIGEARQDRGAIGAVNSRLDAGIGREKFKKFLAFEGLHSGNSEARVAGALVVL